MNRKTTRALIVFLLFIAMVLAIVIFMRYPQCQSGQSWFLAGTVYDCEHSN